MRQAHECRSKANHYAELAQAARSMQDRDRFLRMKRSYDLMARSADFGVELDDLIQRLKG